MEMLLIKPAIPGLKGNWNLWATEVSKAGDLYPSCN